MTIRAVRMGFWWTGTLFLRLSGAGPFKAECYPAVLIPNAAKSHETHWVWWEKKLNWRQIKAIKNVVRLKRPVSFWFDENGRSI